MNKLLSFTNSLPSNDNSPALMMHVVLGYPSLEESIDIAVAMVEGGADLLELQIPFSDPIADGPTIMSANHQALEKGVTIDHCFAAMKKLEQLLDVPLLFMSYFNPLFKMGFEKFAATAREAGASGLIVADLPFDEPDENYLEVCKANDLLAVPVISPLTSDARLEKIAQLIPQGFAYCVSSAGTTGVRKELPKELGTYLGRVRDSVSIPLAVGFGISSAEHVSEVGKYAEIAIVGSASIKLIESSPEDQRLANVRDFSRSLRN